MSDMIYCLHQFKSLPLFPKGAAEKAMTLAMDHPASYHNIISSNPNVITGALVGTAPRHSRKYCKISMIDRHPSYPGKMREMLCEVCAHFWEKGYTHEFFQEYSTGQDSHRHGS